MRHDILSDAVLLVDMHRMTCCITHDETRQTNIVCFVKLCNHMGIILPPFAPSSIGIITIAHQFISIGVHAPLVNPNSMS